MAVCAPSAAAPRAVAPPDPLPPVSTRTRCAVWAGAAVAGLSRRFGYGGGMIGGRIALMLRPGCLAELTAGRHVALVSGTNGKTTTTAMLAAALRTMGPVASNSSGANMLDGLTAAVARSAARLVAGEIDEWYLPEAIRQVRPRVVVLLNLSRDQLDRAGEIRALVRRLAAPAVSQESPVFVANADDPNVVAAVRRRVTAVVWVAAGGGASLDRAICPGCGCRLRVRDAGWACPRCGLAAPRAQWRLTGPVGRAHLVGLDGRRVALHAGVPGRVNSSNAAMAIVAANLMGVPVNSAADGIATVTMVAGRYAVVATGEHEVECVLAKNPASWASALELLAGGNEPLIIAINARQADGLDSSWLYDVPFERLARRRVVVAGERAADVGVRLTYAGIPHQTAADPLRALDALPPGRVKIVADYTSFHQLHRVLPTVHR